MRTCFRRELNTQKNTKSGQAASKRRKYVYFDKLLFLLPCIENRPTEGNISPAHSQDVDDNLEGDTEDGPSTSTPIRYPRRQKKNVVRNSTADDCDNALLQALKDTKDEDTNFALSIVPSLQALNPEEKLDAKINILNIFKNILAKRHGQVTSQQSQPTVSYTILQQPLSSFPITHQGTNFPIQQVPIRTTDYSPSTTPSPHFSPAQNVQDIPNITSPGSSNNTAHSYYSRFSEDSELIDL